jgi:acyl transferase domain-containing protein
MGWALAEAEPAVRQRLDQVLELFAAEGVDLASVLDPGAGEPDEQRVRLAQTDVTQPALFAVEWTIGRTLLDCGVQPYALLGHSVGELAAAALAGVWTLESAVQIVAARGRLMAATPSAAMGYARLTEAQAVAAIAGRDLVIAAVNAERLVTVAGPADAVDEFVRDVSGGRLEVTRAFHSPLVAPAAADFVEIVERHKLSPPEIPVVSNVTGDYLTDEQATSAEYWGEHLRSPVRFADGVHRLLADGVDCFVELSPDRSLRDLVAGAAQRVSCVPTLVTGAREPVTDLLDPLTEYWLAGGEVCWDALYDSERRTRQSLPLYPFARTRHWVEPRTGHRTVPVATVDHAVVPAAPSESGRTPMHEYLIGLWRSLLGGDDVGLHDNFFEVGGHSLLAMQMVTLLERDGAEGLALTTVFELPTIAQLADHLDAAGMSPPAHSGAAEPPAHTDDPTDDRITGLLASLVAMSDDEVRAQLARMEETGR